MKTKNARDFLDKELFVKRSIVTFRALSRELGIHVNEAKNELQSYYDAVRDTDVRAVPTYLVSGELPALTVGLSRSDDSAMDVDLEFEEEQEEREVLDVVNRSMVLLVDASALDEAMTQFSRVHSVHIYSLSPSQLGDAGLVCTQSSKVRKADIKGGQAYFSTVGKITGSHVKLKSGVIRQSAASSSKMTLDAPAKAALKTSVSMKAEQTTTKGKIPPSETKEQVSTTKALSRTESTDKPKPSGKLDWSKAKTKEKEKEKEPVVQKTREDKKPKPKPEPESAGVTKAFWTNKKPEPRPAKPSSESDGVMRGAVEQRGIKRKPQLDTDIESESEPCSAKAKLSAASSHSSVKKGVVYSEEDDEDGEVRMLGQRRLKRKSTLTSDSEMSLLAMMDIDDERVDRVSRSSRVYAKPEESEESAEEEADESHKSATAPPVTSEGEESEDDVPIVPKKKTVRKPRKVVPVGRNGLKKRRVVKSRTTTDAKGYVQTEDYSSYESVEEEEEVETKPKGKGKGKGKGKETKTVTEPKVEEAKPAVVVVKEEGSMKPKAKAAPKPRGGAPKRGGLLNFFGPERGKK